MNVNELRVGNYIDNNVECFQIQARDLIFLLAFDNEHYANPIPLTEEWLFRFDFKHEIGDYYHKKDHYFGIKFLKGKFTFPSFWHVEIKYLHQLQNLYFALTQEELCLKP